MASATTTAPRRQRPRQRPSPRPRRRRQPGWVPDQHGAWAMLLVPLAVGILLTGPALVHLPLSVLWVVGYLDFSALGLWLRSHGKARYLPPVRAYALVLVVPAVAVLWLRPDLLVWVPAFVPLVAVSLVCSWRRADRSLLNDGVTVLAACLVLPVAVAAGTPAGAAPAAGWAAVWAVAAVLLVYFLGTVLYVKTMIRERGRRGYLVASVGYHVVAVAVVAVVLAAAGLTWWPVALLVAVLAVRAALVPRTGARPVDVGLGEMLASALLAVLLLLA